MTLEEVKAYCGFSHDCEVAKIMGFTKTTISYWKKAGVIPEPYQAILQIRTGGALKADIKADLVKPKLEEAP